jgi:hypothetical protein
MESNFNNREFEQYVKSTADQYRMIPSEKVWKGINASLHTRRRWHGFGLTLLLLLTTVSVTWVMVSYPVSKKQEIASVQKLYPSAQIKPVKQDRVSIATVPNDIGNISFNKFTATQDDSRATTNNQRYELADKNNENNNNETDPASLQIADSKTSDPGLVQKADKFPDIIISEKKVLTNPVADVINGIPEPAGKFASDKKVLENIHTLLENKPIARKNANYYPLSIESVLNSYQPKKVIKRLTWQLYFAPTVSYRKLSVNKSYEGNVSPFSATNYPFASSRDVNSEVVHKPDMGLELGVSTKYPITKNLKLSGGLQFNINRYDIKAFAYYGEQATINLNGGSGNNSVTAWTYYRNHDGYKSDWLKNFYFSVSAPVGAELRLFGNNKTYVGIAGALQPTYIIKDRAFLISTDYKNYVEIPSFVRHLNINTSFETFISYTSHSTKTRWQIGPQVRYQVLSSFKNKYPVTENLFDFGLKVGVSHNR